MKDTRERRKENKMIKAEDAIAKARELIGTPYGTGAGQLDCINLVKKIIRECHGAIESKNQ